MDLIQTMEDNPIAIFKVKGLLSNPNKPKTPGSIVDFVLDFEPFLEQTTQVFNLKKEYASNLDRRTKAMLQQ